MEDVQLEQQGFRLTPASELNSKDRTYWTVLQTAIDLDSRKGHLKWTISDLSRASGITRSLIYYYFGREKEKILYEAVRLVGEDLFGLSESRRILWSRGEIAESIWRSREVFLAQPLMQSFYFAQRSRETSIGEEIRELEKKHFDKLRNYFPSLNSSEYQQCIAVIIGLVFAPGIDRQAVDAAVDRWIKPIFRRES